MTLFDPCDANINLPIPPFLPTSYYLNSTDPLIYNLSPTFNPGFEFCLCSIEVSITYNELPLLNPSIFSFTNFTYGDAT